MRSRFWPLDFFYEKQGLPIPSYECVEPQQLPEPQQTLLVHDRDMTPTLEAAYGGKLIVEVLRYVTNARTMNRLVALRIEGMEAPVAVGAIEILMDPLPASAREKILGLREPYGRILQEAGLVHCSRPFAYFTLDADALLTEALQVQTAKTVYGRRSTIWDSSGEALAEVVEILPPGKRVGE